MAAIGHWWQDTLVHYFVVVVFCLFGWFFFFLVKWGDVYLGVFPKQLHAALILALISSFVVSLRCVVCPGYLKKIITGDSHAKTGTDTGEEYFKSMAAFRLGEKMKEEIASLNLQRITHQSYQIRYFRSQNTDNGLRGHQIEEQETR